MSDEARAGPVRTGYVTRALVAGIFIGGLGDGVAFPTLPQLGPILGISPFLVGVILSANRLSRMVAATPAGQLVDRVGTRRPLIVGFVAQGVGPFGYAIALYPEWLPVGSATAFVASRVVWGAGSAIVSVGTFSTVTHVTTTSNRGRWIGYTRAAMSLGYPTGLVLGGVLADTVGYAAAFVTSGTLGLLAAVIVFAILPDVRPESAAGSDGPSGLTALLAALRADLRILSISTVNFVTRMLFGGVLLSTAVLFAADRGIRVAFLSNVGVGGVILAASVLTIAGTTLAVGRFSDRVSNRALVVVPALAVLAAGFAPLGYVSTLAATFVCVVLIGIGVGGTNPPLLAYLGDISPGDDVGKYGGVYNAFGDLGATIGPLVALPLVAEVGFTALFLGCAVLVVFAGVLVSGTLVSTSQVRPATG
jgi:MFS family permease